MNVQNLFKGRLNRTNTLIAIGCLFLLGVFAGLIASLVPALSFNDSNNGTGQFGFFFLCVILVIVAVFMISVWVRRWHDLGKSGWYLLLNFVPIVGSFMPFYLLLAPGEDKDNQYGKKPGKVKFPDDLLGNT